MERVCSGCLRCSGRVCLMSARVEAYLAQFRRELWNHGVVNSRIIEETRDHLLDGIHAARQRGISLEGAESQALARFGSAEEAAAYFAEENEVDPKGWTKFGRRLDGAAR